MLFLKSKFKLGYLLILLVLCISLVSLAIPVKLNGPFGSNTILRDYTVSENGTYVVYIANQINNNDNELFVTLANGSGTPVRLNGTLTTNGNVIEFQVSKRNDYVVYIADQNANADLEIFSVKIDGSELALRLNDNFVTRGDVIENKFKISENGQYVVYLADAERDGIDNLYSVPINGLSPPVKLNNDLSSGQKVIDFKISKTSSHVVYISDQDTDGDVEIYSVPIDRSSASIKLNSTLDNNGDVGDFDDSTEDFLISDDGSWVIYFADQDTNNVLELYSAPTIGGSNSVKLNGNLPNGGDVSEFKISPDGSRVVYIAEQSTNNILELYSVPINHTGNSIKLNGELIADGEVCEFQISNDGMTVVYVADQDTNNVDELYSVSITGGNATKLNIGFPDDGNDISFSISKDSATVVYLADQLVDETFELFVVPIHRQIGPGRLNPSLVFNGDVRSFQISEDSRHVVYLADQIIDDTTGVFSAPIDGTLPPIQLNTGGDVIDFIMNPNSCGIVYKADQDINGLSELYSNLFRNSAPSVEVENLAAINENTLFIHTFTVVDPEVPGCQTLSFSLGTNAPAGSVIDELTGEFRWMPTETQGPNNYLFTVNTSDNGSPVLSASRDFSLIVNEVNTAPAITSIINQTIDANVKTQFTIAAMDQDVPVQNLTFELGNNSPAGAEINAATGEFSWTPVTSQSGTDHVIIVNVRDNGSPNLSRTISFTLSVTQAFTLSTSIVRFGTVSPTSGDFNVGTSVIVTPMPALGYEFLRWTGDITAGNETNNPLTVVLNSDVMITAEFGFIVSDQTLLDTFGRTNVDLSIDHDMDGFSTRKEFEIGTDPDSTNNSVDDQSTINIKKGWNLVAFKAQPLFGTTLKNFFPNVIKGKEWEFNRWLKLYELNNQLINRLGYWMYASSQMSDVQVPGYAVVNPKFTFYKGWNLASPLQSRLLPLHETISSPAWYWNVTKGLFQSVKSGDSLISGTAYWLFAKSDITIDF